MKKGLWIIIFAALVVGTAWAVKFDPEGDNVCRAGSIEDPDPDDIESEEAFVLLYNNCNARIGDIELDQILVDDGWEVWNSGSLIPVGKSVVGDNGYFIVKFNDVPSGYTTGTLHWQVWTEEAHPVYLYRWNGGHWTLIDSNAGCSGPPWYDPPNTETREIPSSFFDYYGNLRLLFTANGGAHWLKCDICQITYTP